MLVKDLRECDRIVEFAISTSTRGIYCSSDFSWDDAVVVTISDASFCQEQEQVDGITRNFKSQQACITALAPENAMNAERMLMNLLSWSSTRIRRVCRSTLMAEAYALSNAVEHGLRTRAAIVDMRGQLNIRQWEETASAAMGNIWFTDCESFFAHLMSVDITHQHFTHNRHIAHISTGVFRTSVVVSVVCVKAGKEMYGVLARYTNSEALTIVKSVSEMDGVRAWERLHANYSRRTLGRMFRVQRENMYPRPVKDVGQVRSAVMRWEEKWKVMMPQLEEGAKIPDQWRMSALLEIRPKDVKEQMLLRLDDVGENYENLKVKVISYTSNKAEQSRVPMELDYVSGIEMYEEEGWDDVDEVRRDRRCHNCGMMGHFARDCRTRSKGKWKGKDEGKGYGKGKGKTMKGTGKKGAGKSGRFKGGRGEQNDQGYQGRCWSCGKTGHQSSECRCGVDNVDDDDDEVDSYSSSSGRRSGDQPESEKGSDVGGVWIVGNVEEMEDEAVSDAFNEHGADQRDGSSYIRADQRDGFNKNREDRRDGFSKIHADQGDGFGLYSRRRTCKCQEETGETKRTSRRNRFFALTAIESDDDEEVNAIETVQEVVEITVDSGAAKSVWPSRKKGVERTKSKKAVKLAAANGSPIRVEGDARF